MISFNTSADSQTVANLEKIEYIANHIVAASTIALYWFIVLQIACVLYVAQNSYKVLDIATAWVSDQLGHTQGFFVQTVTDYSVPSPIASPVVTIADLAIETVELPVVDADDLLETAYCLDIVDVVTEDDVYLTEVDPSDFKVFIPCTLQNHINYKKPGRKAKRSTIQSLIEELV